MAFSNLGEVLGTFAAFTGLGEALATFAAFTGLGTALAFDGSCAVADFLMITFFFTDSRFFLIFLGLVVEEGMMMTFLVFLGIPRQVEKTNHL